MDACTTGVVEDMQSNFFLRKKSKSAYVGYGKDEKLKIANTSLNLFLQQPLRLKDSLSCSSVTHLDVLAVSAQRKDIV